MGGKKKKTPTLPSPLQGEGKKIAIVHTLEDALAALAAGEAALQSAPDALFYAGSLYLLKMFTEAKKSYPQSKAIFIVDCGDARAKALEAMHTGHTHICLQGPDREIEDIAAKNGVTVHYRAL